MWYLVGQYPTRKVWIKGWVEACDVNFEIQNADIGFGDRRVFRDW